MLRPPWSYPFSAALPDIGASVKSAVLDAPLAVTAPIFAGLQIIVALSSRVQCRIDGGARFEITEPGVYVVLARSHQHEGYDRFAADAPQRFVRIGLDPEAAQRYGLDVAKITGCGGKCLHGGDVLVVQRGLTPALKAIATQALVCPVQGAMQDVYLTGKCLELTAVAAQTLFHHASPAQRHAMRGADLERLWHARELARQHYQQPLSLRELARRVGTNVNTLTAGFRQVFGMSVFAYVQHHRLQEAHRMLATGGYSVSEVAAFVGYAIPHFSTVFRKRFGVPPSQLVR